MRVGKTGEMVVNWNNSRPWIGLFQGAKCDNVSKCNLKFALEKSVVVAVTPFHLFILFLFFQLHSPEQRNVFLRRTHAAPLS